MAHTVIPQHRQTPTIQNTVSALGAVASYVIGSERRYRNTQERIAQYSIRF